MIENKQHVARKLRAQGFEWAEIAWHLASSLSSVKRWVNPGFRDRNLLAGRKWRLLNKARKDETHKRWRNGMGRFRVALANIRAMAKRRGYAPCHASDHQVASAFTGRCHICRAPESTLTRRLAIDHSHVTGQFRGWLCQPCNTAMGIVDRNRGQFERYMRTADSEALT